MLASGEDSNFNLMLKELRSGKEDKVHMLHREGGKSKGREQILAPGKQELNALLVKVWVSPERDPKRRI